MSRKSSSDSSSSDAPPASPTPLCIICDQAAVGVAPFSRCHMCSQHLSVDVANLFKLKEEVEELLPGAAGRAALLRPRQDAESLRRLALDIQQQLQEVNHKFDLVQQHIDSFRSRVTGQLSGVLEAVRVCERDLEDVSSYKQEVATAEAAGDMAELLRLVQSMHESLGDLEADFERSERLLRDQSDNEELQLRLLGQLERLVGICAGRSEEGDWSRDAAVTATSEEIDAAERERMLEPMVFSHEVKLDGLLHGWLCAATPADSLVTAQAVWFASTQRETAARLCLSPASWHHTFPTETTYWCCLWTAHRSCGATATSTGRIFIRGLHCDRQLLFIAQRDAVTVTDLSGRAGFGDIRGIGGNAASVFVSSGNKIAAFSKATWQMETVITLSQLPHADLLNMATHDNCILVTDWEHKQVHRVRIDTQQLVASFPTQRSGLQQFSLPYDVAVDSRGRLFVSEWLGHSVRAVAADDGSLLWTLGTPGESGSGDGQIQASMLSGGGDWSQQSPLLLQAALHTRASSHSCWQSTPDRRLHTQKRNERRRDCRAQLSAAGVASQTNSVSNAHFQHRKLITDYPTMSRRSSSDSSSSDAPPASPTPLCIICDQAAVRVAPFSRCHMCSQHLSVDVANLFEAALDSTAVLMTK
uniref:B box-type domain-containing protein n=1 Tax=Macrostomum lignano TaxID=282301 RepID=A0A1I8JF13_9PLAT